MARQNYILGLDIGTNSVGWAAILLDKDQKPIGILGTGVRIFPEGVDRTPQGNEESKNAARRAARAMRRQHWRRNRRRDSLKAVLTKLGLLPAKAEDFQKLVAQNPYELRDRGLSQALSPYEFGRALYHLGQRRGFKSNRKTGNAKEDGIVKKSLTELGQQIEESRSKTLGQYLHRLQTGATPQRLRGRYTAREMYENEFILLWEAQLPHLGDQLSDDLRNRIHHVIFHQRPLKNQKFLVGECEFEKGKKRSPKGTWYAQQFRLLQEVNNLKVIDTSTGELLEWDKLPGKRELLIEALQKSESMDWDKVRKTLGLMDTQKFNLEEGGRKKLLGNQTEWNLRQVFKKDYDKKFAGDEGRKLRDDIIHDLLFVEDEKIVDRHARTRWGMNEEQIERLLKRELPAGYLNVSHKAIMKMLPFLEKGMRYMAEDGQSTLKAAGYSRKDERKVTELPQLDAPPAIRNPIVEKALHELRHVVNAIVREWGKPKKIRVELARDLKNPKWKREEIAWEQRDRERYNEKVAGILRTEFNIASPSRDDIVKYKLWEECEHTCPYTGKTIQKEALFTNEWDVEHILPYSRSLDNSYLNKTLCWAKENREHKKNRTPYEAYHGTDKYGEILLRIQKLGLPGPKQRKFRQKELELDNFISRQLNDTRYISRQAISYLEPLVGQYGVEVGRGNVTSDLRYFWGLNSILSSSGEKTRDDHRHHAVDAVVVALTSRQFLKEISGKAAMGRNPKDIPPPWDNFRENVKTSIDRIIVSHRVLRKIRGALHEETNYGILKKTDSDGQNYYAVRKSIAAITASEIAKIGDPVVQKIIREHLAKNGVTDLTKSGVEKSAEWKKAMLSPDNLPMMPNKNGPPVHIRKVRLHIPSTGMEPMKNPAGENYRAVKKGSNHHIVIYEHTDSKGRIRWDGEVVSMLEAARRARRGEPIIRRNLGDGKKFIMSLSTNETIRTTNNGTSDYWRVQVINARSFQIGFRRHTAANIQDNVTRLLRIPDALRELSVEKVTVCPAGHVKVAHD